MDSYIQDTPDVLRHFEALNDQGLQKEGIHPSYCGYNHKKREPDLLPSRKCASLNWGMKWRVVRGGSGTRSFKSHHLRLRQPEHCDENRN